MCPMRRKLCVRLQGGWRTPAMVQRYAHLAPDHLDKHAERLAKPKVIRTITGTPTRNALPEIAARR
ncbi:hypothetical protein BN874_1910016 [Candidatus Contendobacter odensis Run_B_J11]|uniref:Tyr recombinase domain-containing protein n=1 Tax=Candidatus Contendobacter odensis Run_B_J11 TaxID=1400861 RepID=A0A7U7GAG2_9GAMM|nr:hypothetical protein BN874_1910016 [Candidatus Contendobacter odensis Run_B_J11]